jgi:NitT/TauT family transport system substrate-binding protein
MRVGPASKLSGFLPLLVAATIGFVPVAANAETLEIGIGTQNTTTNTVTGGVVLKELGLLEKHLPKTGKYKDFQYKLSWQNATSGPPITNGMMANNIQIGMMGDYPLMVNGATGQATKNETPSSPTTRSVAATASSFTRIRRSTSSPISRARTSRCRSARQRTA